MHGVGGLSCGEDVGVLSERISLIVVGDGIREVHGVGGVGTHRVKQFNRDAASGHLDFGSFDLRRRHNDFLRGVVHFDQLVEYEREFGAFTGFESFGRSHSYNVRWSFVVGAAVRARTLVGAGRDEGGESH